MRSRSTRRTTPLKRSGARRTGALLVAYALVVSLALPASSFATDVFIDPGHGGSYPGATYAGVREATVNLWLSLELRAVLRARGYGTRLSREGDYNPNTADIATWHWDDNAGTYGYYADGRIGAYPIPYDDLQARCDMANGWGADIFVSIHNNAAGSSAARGTETYYNWDNPTDAVLSGKLAGYVQEEVRKATGMADRGTGGVGYYVIKWANMPGILVEGGFLSNAYDRALLMTPSFRRRMAEGIANGIDRFMAEDPFKPVYPRLAGVNRYETAAQIARKGWPNGAKTVLLASGTAWPDALAATPLSVKLDAPLLLTRPEALSPETAAVLQELAPDEIVVLGGVGAVTEATSLAAGEAVVQAAPSRSTATTPPAGPLVRRLAGPTRYDTAAAIADELGVPSSGEVVLVNGATFPDALSASAYAGMTGAPVLLTEQTTITPVVREFLDSQEATPTRALIVGGRGVVDTKIFQNLAVTMSVRRAAGANRYLTNLAVMRMLWPTGDIAPYVATGTNFPDALCAGSIAARDREPVMLLAGQVMSAYQREFLMHEESRIEGFTVVGGNGAVPYVADWELQKAMRRH